jgi:hypothetical protein
MTRRKSLRIKQSFGRPPHGFYPGDPGSRRYRETQSEFRERNHQIDVDESPNEILRKLKKRIKTATDVKKLEEIVDQNSTLFTKYLTRKARANFAYNNNSHHLPRRPSPTIQEKKTELLKYIEPLFSNLIAESHTEILKKLKKRIKTATDVKELNDIVDKNSKIFTKYLTRKARAHFAYNYNKNSHHLPRRPSPTLQEQKVELLKYV